MTDVQRPKRRYDRLPANQCLNESGADPLILLKLDLLGSKKKSASPSKQVLDGLLKIGMDEFVAYQSRIGKVPD